MKKDLKSNNDLLAEMLFFFLATILFSLHNWLIEDLSFLSTAFFQEAQLSLISLEQYFSRQLVFWDSNKIFYLVPDPCLKNDFVCFVNFFKNKKVSNTSDKTVICHQMQDNFPENRFLDTYRSIYQKELNNCPLYLNIFFILK